MKYSTEIQQSTEFFLRENQTFDTNFFGQRKKYRISRTIKILQRYTASVRKKLKLFKETKKKKMMEEKKCSLRLKHCTTNLAW